MGWMCAKNPACHANGIATKTGSTTHSLIRLAESADEVCSLATTGSINGFLE